MIYMTGTDHELAPVDVRAVFAMRKQELLDALETLKRRLRADGVVILMTCNRMEIYVSGENEGPLFEELCALRSVSAEDYRGYFRDRAGNSAAEHLFYLTCGLRSAILAEDQILTQVKDALALARANYAADSVLEVLFRKAVSAAKRVKTCVSFSRGNVSAIDAACDMLKKRGYGVAGRRCMVIGNGEYGRLAAETLRDRGADVTVTVRQYHSGMVMIPEGCRTILYGDKMELFPKCDLVVSATASPNYTMFYDKVAEALPDHPVVLIDFAVPPDIDPKIAELPNCELYNIDDFRAGDRDDNAESRAQADAILSDYLEEFFSWATYRDLVPLIGEISGAGARDIEARIGRTVRRMDASEDAKRELISHVEDASEKVIAKLLFTLRDALPEASFRACVNALEEAWNPEKEKREE